MRLRIISGEFKGRWINVPKSNLIRPTTDRVRETLFNLLTNELNFENIKVLDLYAGSGALGLEFLSRGALEVHFVEKNLRIYNNLLRNIKSLDVENYCSVYKISAEKFSQTQRKNTYDLILADPPFFKNDIYQVAQNIIANKYLQKDAFMVIERSVQTKEKDIRNFNTTPFKIIGDTCLYKINYH
ncbi:MAG: 16S rRNA (guanine(966)-N(2))-methyltransferase RsmD [Ignavibacterium sp.]|nr:MAG: 16S rRNA (guanine(966)-N(2))-methyltransferase RsmD [Ignavibacterium sp.]